MNKRLLRAKSQAFKAGQRCGVYPFDPRLEVEFITRHFGIFNFATVMKVGELDPVDAKPVKKFFKKQGLI